MIIEEKDGITFDNAVFERPSIRQICKYSVNRVLPIS